MTFIPIWYIICIHAYQGFLKFDSHRAWYDKELDVNGCCVPVMPCGQNRDMYDTLEQILGCFIPLFERVLTDLLDPLFLMPDISVGRKWWVFL